MNKVYIVRGGEMGCNIYMVTTDKERAEATAKKEEWCLSMSGSHGTAWVEEYEVEN